jgi:peptide/nickel transport system substrate-binding protein
MARYLRSACVAGVAAGSLLIAACGSDSNSAKPASKGGALTSVSMILASDIDTFDPHKGVMERGSRQLADAVYDTLVRIDSSAAPGTMKGSLAESWDVTASSATFKIKSGLTCGDGTPLTASGIAKSLQRIANPDTGTPYGNRVFGPGGAKEIKADDAASTIAITVNKPYSDLLFGMSTAFIVCPNGLEDAEALAQKPAETGPYTLTKSKRGDSYTLTRRDKDAAVEELESMPKQITLRVVEDDTTRANLLGTGAVDITPIEGRDAERLKKQFKVVEGMTYLPDALLFNHNTGRAGADPALRKALAQAVDAASYAKAASGDLGKPIRTMYTPNMECYTDKNESLTPAFDLESAKADLKAAGYGPGGKSLKLRVIGFDTQLSGPEYIADALRKLGIDVSMTQGTLGQLIDIVFGTGDWDVMVYQFDILQLSPYGLVNQISYAYGKTLNGGGVQNAEYDRLALEASAAMGDERCALWEQAEAALLGSVDVKPLQWRQVAWFHKSDVKFDANAYIVNTRTISAA